MHKLIAPVAFALAATFLCPVSAVAGGDLSQQKPITVRVNLGKDGTENHKFHPEQLSFEIGKLYRLVLHNPSNSKHYFTSLGFASKVWTRNVQITDDSATRGRRNGAKQVAEIKGAIQEIEVYPGATTEWWFIPVATGTITDLHCRSKNRDGIPHADMGMTGTITIM